MYKINSIIIFCILFLLLSTKFVNISYSSETKKSDIYTDKYINNIIKKDIPQEIKDFCIKYSDELLAYIDNWKLISIPGQMCLGFYYYGDDDDKSIDMILNSVNASDNSLKPHIFKFIDDLCKKNNKKACRTLAFFYTKGIGTDLDLNKAIKLYQSDILKNDEYSNLDLAIILEHIIGTPQSISIAMEIYKNLINSDNKYPTYRYLEFFTNMLQIFTSDKTKNLNREDILNKLQDSDFNKELNTNMVSNEIKELIPKFFKASNQDEGIQTLRDLFRQLRYEDINLKVISSLTNKGK